MIDFLALIPFVIITTFTPGPNNITCASMGIQFGIRRSLPFMTGIVSGFLAIMILAGFFSNLLFQAIPLLEPVMRWIGAAYILYLAYGIIKSDYHFETQVQSQPFGFLKGFLLQFINPKGIIYALTLYSAFLFPIIHLPAYIFLAALALSSTGFLSILTWTSLGALISKIINQGKTKKIINTILALLLVYTAVKLTGLLG